jgi:hypothetical protein
LRNSCLRENKWLKTLNHPTDTFVPNVTASKRLRNECWPTLASERYDPFTIRIQIDEIERQRQEEVLSRKEEFNLMRTKTAQWTNEDNVRRLEVLEKRIASNQKYYKL